MIGASVRKTTFILFVVMLFAGVCRGEARWCDITGHADSNKLFYPPIARAANVSGTVLARITYTSQGDVKDVISISGPPMLAKFTVAQIKDWHMKTNAAGEDLCQSLVIVEFHIGSDVAPPVTPPQPGSIVRLSVETQPLILYSISDPAPKKITRRRRFLLF
jgi:hypothetical protein